MKKIDIPSYIESGSALDDRGSIDFFNELYSFKTKRFYLINNIEENFIRAWHAHKKESKLFYCIEGHIQISTVKIDNFKKPNKNSNIVNFFLSNKTNKLVYVPGGYANGIKFFTNKTRVLVFSTSKLEESLNDDFRYQFDYWNPWKINYR